MPPAGQHDLVAHRLQGRPYHFLILAEAVERRGIEKIDPEIEGAGQQIPCLAVGHRHAIGMADIHAAKADFTDLKLTDPAFFHLPFRPFFLLGLNLLLSRGLAGSGNGIEELAGEQARSFDDWRTVKDFSHDFRQICI